MQRGYGSPTKGYRRYLGINEGEEALELSQAQLADMALPKHQVNHVIWHCYDYSYYRPR